MSTFAEHVDDYLRLRRGLGFKLEEHARLLPKFAAHLDAIDAEVVTLDLALRWAVQPVAPAGSVVPAMRLLVVRGFARCMAGIDPRTEVPPSGLIPLRRHRRPPFIYTDEQVLALMERARTAIRQRLVAATYETLIGLLAATGMRISEAIKLDNADIDWQQGVLLVRESKFNKSRYLPVHPSTLDALERYAHERDRHCPKPRDPSFFVSLRRRLLPLGRTTAARARRRHARRRPGGPATTLIAPTLQAFFTDRLTQQLNASPRTIASYRDSLRLLLCFADDRTGIAIGAGMGRPRRAADRRVPRAPRDRAAQQRTNPQPAADRDPRAVPLRRAAPPRTRRSDRARAEHPRQTLRPTARDLPHRRGIRRADRRGLREPLGGTTRPRDAHARAARRRAGFRADRDHLRRHPTRNRSARPRRRQRPQATSGPAH
jgi:integrase/recombinase XerD